MKILGICFGAATVQAVLLYAESTVRTVLEEKRIVHEGNPKGSLFSILKYFNALNIDRIAVTGRTFKNSVKFKSIDETEAVDIAIKEYFSPENMPTIVVSSGGETQLVYKIGANGDVISVHSGNKCAAGTGEFFLQQTRRMNLSPSEAVSLAKEAEPFHVSGRCSVFCKSDCTHALNKGVPSANVASGLCNMMADKVDELIKDMPDDRIAMIGGGTLNYAMVDELKKRHIEVIVPDYSTVFEAYGAALWAVDNSSAEVSFPIDGDFSVFVSETSSDISFHRPLKEAEHLVRFEKSSRAKVSDGDILILGLDVGSTTTKAVLIKKSDKKIVADVYLRTNGDPVTASQNCYKELLRQLGGVDVKIVGLGVTGSGRQIAGLHALTSDIINEIIAHATGAAFYDSRVNTIFEIGGQDAKYTYLEGGVPSDYAMNEACSAGTGSFLEESAFEMLGIKTEDIADYALYAENPPDFTDQCSAFIASDIKRASQMGIAKEDILAGLVYSIALNYLNRVKGNRTTGNKIFMQGGVCYNKAVPVAVASILNTEVIVPPDPGLMGAFGVALETDSRIELSVSEENEFDLLELSNRQTEDLGTFVCAGGSEKCDRGCTIRRIGINGKNYPFGGMCDRYYNMRVSKKVENIDQLNLVKLRESLIFDVYGPGSTSGSSKRVGKSVGIPRSLLAYSLYPLFSNFFNELGFDVILTDEVDQNGCNRVESSFCQPVEVAHGNFYSLLKMNLDYIFLPQVMQIPVENVPTYSRLCPFVQGEPYYMKTTFRKELENSHVNLLTPVLKMEDSYDSALSTMKDVAASMGIDPKTAELKWDYAVEKQLAFERELRREGKKALYRLKKSGKFGIVLVGRPYNAFSSDLNMSIPHKVATRGYMIIPLDMLDFDHYEVDGKMFWAMGQKIMKSAQLVKNNNNLFPFYITNFSCGPDSFILGYFRKVMGSKPSLTLELDKHTADAGVDTRIEAALDVMKKYYEVTLPPTPKPKYKAAKFDFPYVYSSAGEKLHITSDRVEVLIPSFGKRASDAVSAILRNKGINARSLPVLDQEGLLVGRKNTTCKECLPYIINTGAFLKYLEHDKTDNEKVTLFVMATGGGPCRLGQYFRSFEDILEKKKFENAAMLTITDENGYGGLGVGVLLKALQAVIVTDVLSDIYSMLKVTAKNKEHAMIVFEECWSLLMRYFEGKSRRSLLSNLRSFSRNLSKIELKKDIHSVPVISLIGEIFVRRDEFARKNIVDYLEGRGFMVRVAPLSEYVSYGNYVINKGLGERKFSLLEKIKFKFTAKTEEYWEKKIKSVLAESGLYKFEMIEVNRTIEGVNHLLDPNFRGECILTVGLGMREILNDSCGVISIGPFGCMYSRMAEAMLKREMNTEGKARMEGWKEKISEYTVVEDFPFLSIETDGKPFPQLVEANLESFLMQARKVQSIMQKNGNLNDSDGSSRVSLATERS